MHMSNKISLLDRSFQYCGEDCAVLANGMFNYCSPNPVMHPNVFC